MRVESPLALTVKIRKPVHGCSHWGFDEPCGAKIVRYDSSAVNNSAVAMSAMTLSNVAAADKIPKATPTTPKLRSIL